MVKSTATLDRVKSDPHAHDPGRCPGDGCVLCSDDSAETLGIQVEIRAAILPAPLPLTVDSLSAAYRAGYDARMAGQPNDPPAALSGLCWAAWDAGWLDADRELAADFDLGPDEPPAAGDLDLLRANRLLDHARLDDGPPAESDRLAWSILSLALDPRHGERIEAAYRCGRAAGYGGDAARVPAGLEGHDLAAAWLRGYCRGADEREVDDVMADLERQAAEAEINGRYAAGGQGLTGHGYGAEWEPIR